MIVQADPQIQKQDQRGSHGPAVAQLGTHLHQQTPRLAEVTAKRTGSQGHLGPPCKSSLVQRMKRTNSPLGQAR